MYQPPVNVLLKDDKSPIYLLITNEDFPRVLTIRKRELTTEQRKGSVLGPFSSAYKLQEVLKLVRPIFPWCNVAALHKKDHRPCFYYHLHLCPGACVGEVSKNEYAQNIARLKEFLRGKTSEVTNDLAAAMKGASDTQRYEEAAVFRNQIRLIKQLTSKEYKLKPDVVSSINLSGSDAGHRLKLLQQLLTEYQHTPTSLKLSRIEAYDVSNISGQNAAVSMVVATEGEPNHSEYKVFNIKTLNTPNDFQMLREAVLRRQNHPEWGRPDLLVIDGGKGQLRAVLGVLHSKSAVIGITKRPDRIMIPVFQWNLWRDGEPPDITHLSWKSVLLPDSHPLTPLLKVLRDEAHRFANKQRERRAKREFFD